MFWELSVFFIVGYYELVVLEHAHVKKHKAH